MPRQARLDAPGTLHHVIIRGIEKRSIFEDDKDRENFISRMGVVAKETDTAIYAWSLLTNHVHILLRSSRFGLSKYMRRLLTGYAINFNLRHNRHGHLFQNRYKSIVCEEEPYLLELVRYIHLNPLRANLVENMEALERYPWTGHATMMGHNSNDWQATDYILALFDKRKKKAQKNYKVFVSDGVKQGSRDDLVGGGLVRSLGGWSVVKSLRKQGENILRDDRILGSSQFVENLLSEAEKEIKSQFKTGCPTIDVDEYIQKKCKEEEINIKELRNGSRRRVVCALREKMAKEMVEGFGLSMAEAARQLGITTSGISRLLSK